jgi:hypothetical protein
MKSPLKDHWNRIYANNPVPQPGCYEARLFPSLEIIELCAIPRHSSILDLEMNQ